ncbi:MAG: anthranilate phosphoribosyltransferase [Acidobacteria bacterium]|nr:anthranilate phosphoribosyltransferase [Acidobacteriota bacterium]
MFPELIDKLYRRYDLTAAEAEAAMAEVMAGRATPAQIAGLLVALAMKGERASEIAGLARTMRRHAVPLSRPRPDAFDTCGTGGDRSHTVNVSSLAAIVLAACGVPVAKHGNRSVSSRCGSADLFEALGVDLAASPATVERSLGEAGIAFFFAPTFHPSMRHAGPARRELGVRTAFNLLGPLTNPAGVARQVIGVPRPELTDLLARVLGQLGSVRAWVVHGADGVDEISTTGYTKVSELRAGRVRTFYVHPAEFGLARAEGAALRVADVEASVAAARAVLNGEAGPAREFVLANVAAGLVVAERAATLRDGVALGAEALDSGRAAGTLEAMVRCSTAAATGDRS